MLRVSSLEEVRTVLTDSFSLPVIPQKLDVLDALDCTLQEDIFCPEDVPQFTRSTMDGYALQAADTFGASAALPALFEVVGEVTMGECPTQVIRTGTACLIPTGGMLPAGADSVVMVEYTEKLDNSTILVERPVSPGENLILRGEDVGANDLLFPKGHRLRPQDIGVLVSVGIKQVVVAAKPQVGVLSSGNEIVYPFQKIQLGQVRDINSYALGAALRNDGFEPVLHDIITDDFAELKFALQEACQAWDVVLISGGSSVGTLDLTCSVLEAIGAEILVHGVAIKPGKPTIIAKMGDKLICGLPGNPVSAFVIYHVIISPFLREMVGTKQEPRVIEARFADNFSSAPGRDEVLMVKLIGQSSNYVAHPILGKSSMMATMSQAVGYVHIPASNEGLYQDQLVKVHLF